MEKEIAPKKYCRRMCRKHVEKVEGFNILCGIKKTLPGGKAVRLYCGECMAHHEGFLEGYKQGKKDIHECSSMVCDSVATRYISIEDYIIKVCPRHGGTREWKELKNGA